MGKNTFHFLNTYTDLKKKYNNESINSSVICNACDSKVIMDYHGGTLTTNF